MRHLILLLILFVLVIVKTFSQTLPCLGCWESIYLPEMTISCGSSTAALVDSFDDGVVDAQKWELDHGPPWYKLNVACEEQLYFDSHVSETYRPGWLTMLGVKEDCSWTKPAGPDYCPSVTLERAFKSGMIKATNANNQGINFGTIETKMKLPTQDGWWPAFWMWHHDEIDIVEVFEGPDWFLNNTYVAEENPNCPQPDLSFRYEVPWGNIFNGEEFTVRFEWTPFIIKTSINGQEITETTTYRFYDSNGDPLIIDCTTNNVIPAGEYFINPRFVETKSRWFRPIFNLAVLPKSGGSCGEAGKCSDEFLCAQDNTCFDYLYKDGCGCPGLTDYHSSFGYTYDDTAKFQVDYISSYHVPWFSDEGIAIKANDTVYIGSCNAWEIENLTGTAHHNVLVTNISSGSKVTILSNTSGTLSQIRFKTTQTGIDSITIHYINDFGENKSYTHKFVIIDIWPNVVDIIDEECGCFLLQLDNLCSLSQFRDIEISNTTINNLEASYSEYQLNDHTLRICPCPDSLLPGTNSFSSTIRFKSKCSLNDDEDYIQHEYQLIDHYFTNNISDYIDSISVDDCGCITITTSSCQLLDNWSIDSLTMSNIKINNALISVETSFYENHIRICPCPLELNNGHNTIQGEIAFTSPCYNDSDTNFQILNYFFEDSFEYEYDRLKLIIDDQPDPFCEGCRSFKVESSCPDQLVPIDIEVEYAILNGEYLSPTEIRLSQNFDGFQFCPRRPEVDYENGLNTIVAKIRLTFECDQSDPFTIEKHFDYPFFCNLEGEGELPDLISFLSPNPASNHLTVSLNENALEFYNLTSSLEYKIVNQQGNLISSGSSIILENSLEINIGSLPNGTYILSLPNSCCGKNFTKTSSD